jgi:O-antigen/teichoic acid export membrane protein
MLVVGNPAAQVWRNTVASTWKVAVLAVALPLSALDVTLGLAAWTTGLLAGTVIAVRAAAVQMPADRRLPFGRVPSLVREHARTALGHQGVNLALTSSWAAMPALIAWAVSPAENGVFTTVRLVTTQAALLPYALTVSVFAATAGQVEFDAARSRRALLTALGISVVLYVGLLLFGHEALRLFGGRYADEGVPYLRLTALSCVLMVFKDQFIADVRMRREVGSLVPLVSCAVVVEVAFALVGAQLGGLRGALLGWLLALVLQAGYVTPRLSWRRPRDKE